MYKSALNNRFLKSDSCDENNYNNNFILTIKNATLSLYTQLT